MGNTIPSSFIGQQYLEPQVGYPQEKTNHWTFGIKKIENGFLLYYGDKIYMSETLDMATDQVKACIVAERLGND